MAAVLLCAAGTSVPPRGDRLDALIARLRSHEDFTATLSGARVEARGDRVVIGRETGELKRTAAPDIALTVGAPSVWDGRYALTAREPGWCVGAAAGRMATLSDADRAVLKTVPASLRGTLPVLYRDDGSGPVLAWRMAEVRALAPRRLNLALSGGAAGETTHERNLFDVLHGETQPTDLFSRNDIMTARRPASLWNREP